MIIGIDLGTTNSVCAVYDNGEVMFIKNTFDEWLTPSAVSIDQDGTLYVGQAAKTRAFQHPKESIANFKRYMGTNKAFQIHGKPYTPVELSSLVLKSMVQAAEAQMGQTVQEAIISVPAYFNAIQRKATLQAADMIDLNVSKLINEPTAAAIAYGLQDKPEYTDFMIVDLGGGTFDVSIMEYFDGVLEVKASGGDNMLGGEDFLRALVDLYVSKVGCKLETLHGAERQELFARMEAAKKTIHKGVQIEPFLNANHPSIQISSSEYETACQPLLRTLIKSIELCLTDARLGVSDMY